MSLIPKSRGATLARSAVAAVLVIVFTASATAVAGLLQFKQLATEISGLRALTGLRGHVKIPDPGSPQTLLLIGSDHRAGTPWNSSNTDTMMLVHIDPNSSTINLLSVPRDLEVQIPQGGATGKLNSAYSIGGPGLLVRILKQQVLSGLQVNHVIDVNFGGFAALVNAIGCVDTDVDHRYYNNTAVTNYSSIDIQPGYQPLCGTDALAFVRFRHTDSDIVRNARQQDFVRWAKGQFSTTELLSEKDKLVGIFGAHTQTDANLHTLDGLINLFDLVVFSAGHTIKQVPFPAILQPCTASGCYVTAEPGAEHHAFSQFMAPTKAPAGGSGSAGAARHGAGPSHPGPVPALTGDLSDGKAQAAALGSAGFPIYYPRVISAGSYYCSGVTGNCPAQVQTTGAYPRAYQIRDQQRHDHYAYRMTLALNPVLGQYYGVQGTTWLNPPILNSPTQTRNVGGKQLLIYANGGKVSLVAWRTNGAVYWISNTLNDQIGNAQMIAIAASLTH